MTDKNPASLTSSLLARKGAAASSAEDPLPAEDDIFQDQAMLDAAADVGDMPIDVAVGDTQIDADVGGTPIEDETDSFLDRNPDPVIPATGATRRNWDEEVAKKGSGRSRGRRAPVIVLSVLLVFALAGTAWLAANVFLENGGNETRLAANKRLIPVGAPGRTAPPQKSPTAAVQLAPTGQARSTASGIAPTPPAALDPVTNDPQDAPRLAATKPRMAPDAAIAPPRPATLPPPPPAIAAPPVRPRTRPTRVAAATTPPVEPVQPAKMSQPPPPVRAASPRPPAPVAALSKPTPPPVRKTTSTPRGTYSIQLSSVRDRAGARKEARRLANRLASILGGTTLRVRTAKLGSRGTVYRIQTAAVLSSGEAKRLCAAIKSKRQPCFVVAK